MAKILTAFVVAGLLAVPVCLPAQRPEEYYNKGLNEQNAGNLDGAIEANSHAIALDPQYAFALNNRGTTKLAKNDTDGAIALNPKDAIVYFTRSVTNEIRGNFADAKAGYERCINLDPQGPIYARIQLALVLRRTGADDRSAGLTEAGDRLGNDWAKTAGLYLTGRMDESEFIEQSNGGSSEEARKHQCDAYYYVGMTHLLARESAKAREFSQKGIETGMKNEMEYHLPEADLARLR